MISERTLKQWRRDALSPTSREELFKLSFSDEAISKEFKAYEISKQRILRLTQELMDQHLIRK